MVRLGECSRRRVRLMLDGEEIEALEGDTVLTAVLLTRPYLRPSDAGEGHRAGFCLMGACQDCRIWCASGEGVQACRTLVQEGMVLLTEWPADISR